MVSDSWTCNDADSRLGFTVGLLHQYTRHAVGCFYSLDWTGLDNWTDLRTDL